MGEIFILGREMTHPFTSGMHMADLSDAQLCAMTAQLTPEEARSPFADHYFESMAPLQPEHTAALEQGPLLPELCYMPEQAGAVLLDGPDEYPENGYGVLENGVGYGAILIRQAGITDEMIRKYRDEFAQDPYTREHARNLFYKVWFPGAHLIHFEDGVVEDFGWGMMRLEMGWDNFCLRHLGVSAQEIPARDPDCICLLGLGGEGWEIARPEDTRHSLCMVQHTRATSWGRELRVRYWNGVRLNPDGTVDVVPGQDRAQTLKEMRLVVAHCMQEYCNELRLMKAFWSANGE